MDDAERESTSPKGDLTLHSHVQHAPAHSTPDHPGPRADNHRAPTPPLLLWVLFCRSISPTARTAYMLLANLSRHLHDLHTHDVHGYLAAWLGLSRGDKALPYIRELIHLGAISRVQRHDPTGRCYQTYDVHFTPPPRYPGPVATGPALKELAPIIDQRRAHQRTRCAAHRATAPTRSHPQHRDRLKAPTTPADDHRTPTPAQATTHGAQTGRTASPIAGQPRHHPSHSTPRPDPQPDPPARTRLRALPTCDTADHEELPHAS